MNIQLPKEPVVSVTKSEVIFAVLGTIIISLLFNFLAWWYLKDFSANAGYLLIRAKWQLLENLETPVDLLILGDSGGNQGVDPEIISEKTGKSSINLCTIGDAMILNDARMLKVYMDKFGPPRSVLIVHGYDMWSRQKNISVLSKIPGSWWNGEPTVPLSAKERVRIILNRYFPIYAETKSLAEHILFFWEAFPEKLELSDQGFMTELEANPSYVEKDLEVHRLFVRNQDEVISDINKRAIEEIAKLAENYSFNLFIATGPISEKLFNDAGFQRYYTKVQTFLSKLARASTNTEFILKTPVTFPKEQMQSIDHIINAAVPTYTGRLIEAMVLD